MSTKPREELHYKQVYPNFDALQKLQIHNSVENVINKSEHEFNFKFPEIQFTERYEKNPVDFSQVDYNIDGRDLDFLDDQKIHIDTSLFELIMDRIEKEWYFFAHKIIKNTFTSFESSDTACNICSFSTFSSSNNMIFCDGCNICVHQECYGVPIIPPGPWFCKPCLHKVSNPVCKFCLKPGGALKMTNSHKWGHVVCVVWNDELFFSNLVFLEPIEDSKKTARFVRKDSNCIICDDMRGMHIKCAYSECESKYHVACAIEENYYMDHNNLITYCPCHNPLREFKYSDNLPFYPELKQKPKIRNFVELAKPKKSLLLHIKMLKPFVSTYFLDKIYSNDICCFNVSKDIVIKILLYWRKKKRVLFLAPLVPYLYLDVNGGIGWDWYNERYVCCLSHNIRQNEENQQNLIESGQDALKLKNKKEQSIDLQEQKIAFEKFKEKLLKGCHHKKLKNASKSEIQSIYQPIRELCELTSHLCEMQETELEIIKVRKEMLEIMNNPQKYMMHNVMMVLDRDDYEVFETPVTEDIAPNYFDVIETPMDFETVRSKIDSYQTLQEFFADLKLIGENCLLYNEDVDYFQEVGNNYLNEIEECELQVEKNLAEKLSISYSDIF